MTYRGKCYVHNITVQHATEQMPFDIHAGDPGKTQSVAASMIFVQKLAACDLPDTYPIVRGCHGKVPGTGAERDGGDSSVVTFRQTSQFDVLA